MTTAIEAAFQAGDLQLARIGLDNALERAATLESLRVSDDSNNQDPDFPVINVTRRNTYETWRPTTFSPKIVATWSQPVTVDYLAVARHNIASAGITAGSLWVTPADGALTKVAEFTPETDGPLVIPFAPTEIEAAEVRFGTGAHAIVAVIHLGQAVIMPRKLRASMQPVWLSRQTRVETQTSDGGELLGSILIRKGSAVSPQWRNLSRDFYNGTLRDLAAKLPECPFFLQWQPQEHPDEVVYGTVTGDPTGAHVPRSSRYEFGLSMRGIG